MFAIYRKEMSSYFINPIGYIYLGVFLVFSALLCCYSTLISGTYDTSGASHVGIYVGNGMMIHCGNPIQYASIDTSYWQAHFYCFGRLP